MVASCKVNVRLRRFCRQFRFGSVPLCKDKIFVRKVIKHFFARQYAQPARKLCQKVRLPNKRFIIFRICHNVQPVVPGQIIRLVVNNSDVVPNGLQIGLQRIRLQRRTDIIYIVTGNCTNLHFIITFISRLAILPSFALIRTRFGSQLMEYQCIEYVFSVFTSLPVALSSGLK